MLKAENHCLIKQRFSEGGSKDSFGTADNFSGKTGA